MPFSSSLTRSRSSAAVSALCLGALLLEPSPVRAGFDAPIVFTAPVGPGPLAIADFDGDGDHDVVFVGFASLRLLVNDGARELLDLPAQTLGRSLEELGVEPVLRDALLHGVGIDRMVLVGERVLVLNRRPMRARGTVIGSVSTLRETDSGALMPE